MTGGSAGDRWRLASRVVGRGLRLPARIYFEPEGFVRDVGALVPGGERLTAGEILGRARIDRAVHGALAELTCAAAVATVWAALLCAALDIAGAPIDWARAAGILAIGVVAGIVVVATVDVAVGIAVGVGLAVAGGVAGGLTGSVAGEIAVGLAIGLAAGVGLGLAYRIDAGLAGQGSLTITATVVGAVIGVVACVANGIAAGVVLALAVPGAAAITARRPGSASLETVLAGWLDRMSARAHPQPAGVVEPRVAEEAGVFGEADPAPQPPDPDGGPPAGGDAQPVDESPRLALPTVAGEAAVVVKEAHAGEPTIHGADGGGGGGGRDAAGVSSDQLALQFGVGAAAVERLAPPPRSPPSAGPAA